MGAIGGSYGGGYQFLMAFEEIRATGRQVVDALVPEITWHDLEESLAPEGVVRTEWALALSAGSLPSDALPWNVYKALVEGAATGTWPDGSVPGTEDMVTFMEKNGPKWQVGQGARIDVPVLFGQGTTDTLFPLEQALTNWQVALTKKARKRSIFTAYNGGHVLPAVLPAGVTVDSDPCAEKLSGGDFTDLTLAFLDRALKGGRRTLRGYGRLHLATPDSGCVSTRTVARRLDLPVGTVATTAAAATITDTVGAGTVPGHPDKQTTIVTKVRRPPVLGICHERIQIFLYCIKIQTVECFGVIKVLIHGIGLGGMLIEEVQTQLVGPPVLVCGATPCRVFNRAFTLCHSALLPYGWVRRIYYSVVVP